MTPIDIVTSIHYTSKQPSGGNMLQGIAFLLNDVLYYLYLQGWDMSDLPMNTDEFLAIKFPNLRKSWLTRLNQKLGWLKKKNSGNAEMRVHWAGGRDLYTEWTYREASPKDEY